MDAAEIARQRAEARRQKILARQKDRLTAITGVYSQINEREDEAPSSSTTTAAAAAATSSSGGGGGAPALREWDSEPGTTTSATAAAAAGAGAGAATAQAAAAARQREQRELEAMMAQLQATFAQAAAAAGVPPPPPLHAPTDGSSWMGLPGPEELGNSPSDADAANAAMQTLLAGLTDGDSGGGAAVQRRGVWDALQRDTPGVILWFGRILGVIMQETQLVRLLAAAAVAYAAVAGLLQPTGGGGGSNGRSFASVPPLHPALILLATQLSIIGAAVLLLGRRAARRVAERDGQYGGAVGGGVQLPMRLRQLDVLSYLPGAREALAGLSGYRQLADGLSGDAAVYLLMCGLLSLTTRAPATAE